MRIWATLLFTVLVASTAFAQPRNSFSVFYNGAQPWGNTGFRFIEGGPGLAFNHAFSPVFSMELSAARENYTIARERTIVDGTAVFTSFATTHTYPIDLSAQYHFTTDTRWKPYGGLGLRYASTHEVNGVLSRTTTYYLSPEVSGGVVFQLRPRFGFLLDAKELIGNDNNKHSNPSFKASAGLSWRF